jgi:hypothetical protein
LLGIPAILERSRSGNGAHVWIFFSEPVKAKSARKLGFHILTKTKERNQETSMASYDRFFPSQDVMPSGGFGNLIALPLQEVPWSQGNSIFIDKNLEPYEDQWAFLSNVKKMTLEQVESLIA